MRFYMFSLKSGCILDNKESNSFSLNICLAFGVLSLYMEDVDFYIVTSRTPLKNIGRLKKKKKKASKGKKKPEARTVCSPLR